MPAGHGYRVVNAFPVYQDHLEQAARKARQHEGQIAGLIAGWDNQADSKLGYGQKGIIGHWSY
jgi:late competence protein required for DNA uptake (superfamily II DNA/RNA helicase)